MKRSVLVAGSANLDFVVRTPQVPAPGETVLGHGLATFPGGKGANQAVACARAGGAPTRMLLALGDDQHAAPVEASLRAAGVGLDVVRVRGESTGVAFVCLADEGENAITVAPGANAALRPDHLPPLAGIGHLLLQLETPLPAVEAWARAARKAGVQVALNAAPAQALPRGLLDDCHLLIVNEGELAAITGRQAIGAGLDALDAAAVVVTLGARGCCARVGSQYLLQPGFPVAAIDTTGAGDTFCGTLVASLSLGLAYPAALRRACAASALACTRLGAQAGVPRQDEVQRLLAAHAGDATEALAAYVGFA